MNGVEIIKAMAFKEAASEPSRNYGILSMWKLAHPQIRNKVNLNILTIVLLLDISHLFKIIIREG
jgi:hypothetical protein